MDFRVNLYRKQSAEIPNNQSIQDENPLIRENNPSIRENNP
jgi:hypothetical protein